MKHEGALQGRALAPRDPRVAVVFDTIVGTPIGELPARLLNVSASGFRLRVRKPLEPGWEVTLMVARSASVRGVVRWTDGLECGGVFAEPAAL